MISLVEVALGFSQDVMYHFTTPKAADKILTSDRFYPSYVHLQGDEGAHKRYVSFTRNPSFEDGYPWNSRKRQLKPQKNQWGDDQYKDKDLMATVRFTVDTLILSELIQQTTSDPFAEPFEFPVDNLNRGLKPEDEERLWMKLREVKGFTKCIKQICFYSIPSGSDKLHDIAVRVYQAAKSRKIPCTYIQDGVKGENPVSDLNVGNLYTDSLTRSGGREEEASEADYDKLAEAVAVCALDFKGDRHRIVDYIGRKFGKLLDDPYKFILQVERCMDDFEKDPELMNKIKSNIRFITTKETKLPIDIQQAFLQMLDRTLIRTGTSNFTRLVNLRKRNLTLQESSMSNFDYRKYLANNWLLKEAKEPSWAPEMRQFFQRTDFENIIDELYEGDIHVDSEDWAWTYLILYHGLDSKIKDPARMNRQEQTFISEFGDAIVTIDETFKWDEGSDDEDEGAYDRAFMAHWKKSFEQLFGKWKNLKTALDRFYVTHIANNSSLTAEEKIFQTMLDLGEKFGYDPDQDFSIIPIEGNIFYSTDVRNADIYYGMPQVELKSDRDFEQLLQRIGSYRNNTTADQLGHELDRLCSGKISWESVGQVKVKSILHKLLNNMEYYLNDPSGCQVVPGQLHKEL